jgi:Ala-tRNA(Pro) deacylase
MRSIMSMNTRLAEYLDREQASYDTRLHAEAFTAQEVAATSHVPGRDLAKVVVVRGEAGQYLMAVLPAACRLDLETLAAAAGGGHLSLASEAEVRRLFPDCEAGAMPPFGRLYGLPVYMDACFPTTERLFFQAGNHREVVGMAYPEFLRLVNPVVGEFCRHGRPGATEH